MNGFRLEACVEYQDDHEEPGGPCLACGHLLDEHAAYLEPAAEVRADRVTALDDAGYDVSPVAVLAILRRGAPTVERRAS